MKWISVLILCMVFVSSAFAAGEDMQMMAANATAQYLDQICMDTLTLLQQIARNPDTQSARWEAIYPQLEAISHRLPAVYFFVLPDGNYYSVEKGFTNLNLSNRGYFESLFAGNPVLGYEIYSRSSGKKSALMAAPIVVENKVIGALGASIFLDDLHHKINRDLMIPEDYTWFAVNSEGLTMLDQDLDYIFMNTLTQGTKSLNEAITAALKGNGGPIVYDLGNSLRRGVYSKLPSLDWRLILVKKEGGNPEKKAEISMETFNSELQQRFLNLDEHIRGIIVKHQGNWDQEAAIRHSLSMMLQDQQMIVEAAFVDLAGRIQFIEPSEYKNYEGEDISSQDHVAQLRKYKKPVFSGGFESVEGFTAVSIAYPVFEGKSKLKGSISLLLNPVFMVEAILKDINIPASHELCIMEPGGLLIYDQDNEEIGKNLFTDPIFKDYESLLKLGKSMASDESGEGDYVFQSAGHKDKVLKKTQWTTVKLLDQAWRIVISEEI